MITCLLSKFAAHLWAILRRPGFAYYGPATVLLIFTLACGCEPGSSVEGLASVAGQVKYQGNPVEGALVTFHPANVEPTKNMLTSTSTTDAEGRFVMRTYDDKAASSSAFVNGLVSGEFKVSVEKLEDGSITSLQTPPKSVLPSKYAHPETSGLSATVTIAGPNDFTFELNQDKQER